MTRINDLSTISGSTATSSTFIWTVWNGKDYKVALSDLGKFVGRNAGLCTSPNASDVSGNSGDIILWGTTPYWDELGWWDANSVGMVQVKDGRVTSVRVDASLELSGVTLACMGVFLNGTLVTSARAESSFGEGGFASRGNIQTTRFDVSSGDRIELRLTRNTGTGSIDMANNVPHMVIYPEVFA